MDNPSPEKLKSAPAPSMSEDARPEKLRKDIEDYFGRYDRGTKAWITGYNVLIYSSATFSALAAVVLKTEFLKPPHAADISAALAALAALFSTYIAAGGFARKWRANRIARGKINQLKIDLEDPAVSTTKIRDSLKEIIKEEDEGIIGAD